MSIGNNAVTPEQSAPKGSIPTIEEVIHTLNADTSLSPEQRNTLKIEAAKLINARSSQPEKSSTPSVPSPSLGQSSGNIGTSWPAPGESIKKEGGNDFGQSALQGATAGIYRPTDPGYNPHSGWSTVGNILGQIGGVTALGKFITNPAVQRVGTALAQTLAKTAAESTPEIAEAEALETAAEAIPGAQVIDVPIQAATPFVIGGANLIKNLPWHEIAQGAASLGAYSGLEHGANVLRGEESIPQALGHLGIDTAAGGGFGTLDKLKFVPKILGSAALGAGTQLGHQLVDNHGNPLTQEQINQALTQGGAFGAGLSALSHGLGTIGKGSQEGKPGVGSINNRPGLVKDPNTGDWVPNKPEIENESANAPNGYGNTGGQTMAPAQHGGVSVSPDGSTMVTGRVSNTEPATVEGNTAQHIPGNEPWGSDGGDEHFSPETGQPTQQAQQGQPENITSAIDRIRQRQALLQQVQKQGQQMEAVQQAHQSSANPAPQNVNAAQSAIEQLRARQQALLQQQAEQAAQAQAEQHYNKLKKFGQVGLKNQATKLKEQLVKDSVEHPDPIQRAAAQRALDKYAPPKTEADGMTHTDANGKPVRIIEADSPEKGVSIVQGKDGGYYWQESAKLKPLGKTSQGEASVKTAPASSPFKEGNVRINFSKPTAETPLQGEVTKTNAEGEGAQRSSTDTRQSAPGEGEPPVKSGEATTERKSPSEINDTTEQGPLKGQVNKTEEVSSETAPKQAKPSRIDIDTFQNDSAFKDETGALDGKKITQHTWETTKTALEHGKEVILVTDGGRKRVNIVKSDHGRLYDEQGQPWGSSSILFTTRDTAGTPKDFIEIKDQPEPAGNESAKNSEAKPETSGKSVDKTALDTLYPKKGEAPKSEKTDSTERLQDHRVPKGAPQAANWKPVDEVVKDPNFQALRDKLPESARKDLDAAIDAARTGKKTMGRFYNTVTETEGGGKLAKDAPYDTEVYTPKSFGYSQEVVNSKGEVTKPAQIYMEGYNENGALSKRRFVDDNGNPTFAGSMKPLEESGYQGSVRHPSDITTSSTHYPEDAIAERINNLFIKKHRQGAEITDSDYGSAAATMDKLLDETIADDPGREDEILDRLFKRIPEKLVEKIEGDC